MNKEEAKEIIISEKSRELHTYGKTKFVEALDVAIKALEQEPRKGHWIDNSRDGYTQYYCSCCCDSKSETSKKSKYCPNCGCRMIGVEEIGEVEE